MSNAPGGGGGGGGSGAVGGALSLMGCVREASPPPQDHHHHHQHQHHMSLGEFGTQQRSVDTLPKEPKKRRFHPLRGLRRIFRRKSRGAADARLGSRNGERDGDLINHDREEVTLRHPAGRPEEARSRSASELLTDSCDRESVFLRRSGVEESFAKLRGGPGQLSVSHDSVFPGEVPHTRPLSSLDPLATLERRQTKASDEGVHKDYNSRIPHGNRISLRVLEQIKTVIENRNQQASTTSTDSNHTSHHTGERYQQETTENRFTHFEKHERTVDETFNRVTRNTEDVADRESTTPKEDLPELECASLNHTAAHHRISVRPKNRRPPRRTQTTNATSGSTITTITESGQDVPDSVEIVTPNAASSPIDIKTNCLRKSSIRLSRNSDIFEELEAKLPPRKPASLASLSPDSLDSMSATGNIKNNSQEIVNENDETREIVKPVSRKISNRVSKGSEIYEELQTKLPRRRSSSSRLSKSPDSLESGSPASLGKSIDGFDKLIEQSDETPKSRKLSNFISKSTEDFEKLDENVELRPVSRRLNAHQMSKSIEGFEKLSEDPELRVTPRRLSNILTSKSNDYSLKCSDSLDAIETMISDDSIERRRSSFELRPRKMPVKLMSMSTENFETLEHANDDLETRQELLKKRSSASDVNLSRGRRYSKIMSKSSESFDPIETIVKQEESNRSSMDLEKNGWRGSKRTTISSESSDNLELDDNRLENRRSRRPSKRTTSTSIVDIFPFENHQVDDDDRINGQVVDNRNQRKSSRLKKSSESSELGSTDTLDSERRNNKSSDSTETIDSLEKDNEQDSRDEDITDNAQDKRDKNDSWSNRMTEVETANGDEETNRQIVGADKSYWRQTSDSKENIDIHQLLAITIVTRMSDNGNNQRNNSAGYPKKKHQQQQTVSPPTSPNVQQDDNKLIFNNLLTSKNDEDLQNMLNGNISEVSTDTKSFKEKLIMFEKLGK